jgi:hypothetical protein
MSLDVDAINPTDRPLRVIKVRVLRPRSTKIVHADTLLPLAGSPYHSSEHPVPAYGTVVVSIHVMARGMLTRQGKPLPVTFGITDQSGVEHRVKAVLESLDKTPTCQPLRAWLSRFSQQLKKLATPEPQEVFTPPPEWNHGGKFDAVDLILREERRHYAACGRERGGLGSLNISLQSEPNYGWTEVGKVPMLLWRKEDAKRVGSQNLDRLIKIGEALSGPERDELIRYLLSHLHTRSIYADIAYFVFLALHRMSKTVDALRTARLHLVRDKVYGYSNLLGTLSGLISHEHSDVSEELYRGILDALAGEEEHDFRLKEKINLARLHHLDSTASGVPESAPPD